MRTLVHVLAALSTGAGSLKAELPASSAADYNEVARRFFHGLSGVLFFGSEWIIGGGSANWLISTLLGYEAR
jgi:hypothetical protein